jgi:hypothetical protein
MKTNILWENRKLVGVFHGRPERFQSELPGKLQPWSQNLSLETSDQQKSPVEEFTDTDGGVYGVRFFNFMPSQFGGFLVSPTSRFIWESTDAVASDFRNSGAVRGHVGFHAAWPESLQWWQETAVDHHITEVKALVKGYGDLVLGDVGWRSERLTLLSMVCSQASTADKVAARYKGLQVSVGTIVNPEVNQARIEWTIEFQERLDRIPEVERVRRPRRQTVDVSGF